MLTKLPKSKTISYPSGEAYIKVDAFNQRIKIVKFTGNANEMTKEVFALGKEYNAGKIICVATKKQQADLNDAGFLTEAQIEGFFNGETGYYLSKFLLERRGISKNLEEENRVIEKAKQYKDIEFTNYKPEGFLLRDAGRGDAKEMANVYDQVFKTYPTPMNDPEYIEEAMENNVIFKIFEHNGRIVSAASADMDIDNLNAEMTDCATLPEYRGHGLMAKLLFELELELKNKGFILAYTIARSISYGMNIVFAKLNYNYTGRLINNCHICGQFEDMNIWLKILK